MFVGGVRRRGAGQDSFVDGRRSKDIIKASAEEKKKAGGISFGDQLLDYIEGRSQFRSAFAFKFLTLGDVLRYHERIRGKFNVNSESICKRDCEKNIVKTCHTRLEWI